MFSWIKFHSKRRSLEKKIENLIAVYQKDLKKPQYSTDDDKETLFSEFRFEKLIYEDELALLTTNYLTSVAHRRFIPIPEFKTEGGAWEMATSTRGYYLNPEAIDLLRSRIRKENKERVELILLWLPSLTGLIGVIIGLVAVLKD